MQFKANTEEDIEINGIKVHVTYYDFTEGRPIAIVLHGLRADAYRMLPMTKAICDHYNVFAIDFPGHGKSERDIHFEDYTDFGKEILKGLLLYYKLTPANTVLFGTSYGANVIIHYLIENPNNQFERIILYAPIFSYKYLSMNGWYKNFVLWFSSTLSRGGIFYRFVQGIVNNDILFTLFSELLTLGSYNKEELVYERTQWRLMSMKLWGKSIQDFLHIDYNSVKKIINLKKIVFVFPHSDQYIDVDQTTAGFKRLMPNMVVTYVEGNLHVPKGDFSNNLDFLKSVDIILEEAMAV